MDLFYRYWRHVRTPMFIINSQWNQKSFDRITCNVSIEDPDISAYRTGKSHSAVAISIFTLTQPHFYSMETRNHESYRSYEY